MSPPGYPDLTTPLGSYFVLRALANICPGLRTVGFFPTKHHVEEILTNGEWLYLLPFEERFINKDPYLDPLLARLNRLTSLRTQGWILELLPLDTLSRLEWLDVDMHGNSSGDVQILYAQLISIKHLGIFRCKKDDILQMLPKSDIMLTSIEIHTELDNDLVHRMTSSLATYCPLLLDLSLYCAGILQKIEITSIAPLALLPRFQRLRITYSDIVPPNASTDNIFSHINSLLPGLRALEFPHRVVRLSELRDIIHSMPKLERLALYIILEDPGNPELNQPNNSLRILASGFDWNLYLHGKNERDEIVENTVRLVAGTRFR
ncbi:hypothetical protein FRC09_006662 [Ceratobasidium sp. 395]|nr:hypothetical protein FRC09_006662 [Ceratobasidium sp. 395]